MSNRKRAVVIYAEMCRRDFNEADAQIEAALDQAERLVLMRKRGQFQRDPRSSFSRAEVVAMLRPERRTRSK